MTWKEISLDEVVKIKGGKRLPKNTDFVNFETHHPYIRARDIGDGKIEIKDPVYLTEEVYSLIKNYTVSSGDLVITIVGANIGDTAEIKPQFHGANLTENAVKLTVKDVNKLDPVFLKYSLFGDNQKQKLQQIAAGAAQGKLGLYKIKEFKISLPSNIVIQQRIASILSAYDNLIENNLKRIRLLEEAAQMIYREWFVKMRFPGYEEVEWYVDDKGRRFPEGWNYDSLENVSRLIMGQSPSSEFYNTTGDGLPFHQGVTEFGDRFVTNKIYCTSKNRIAEPGDILCSVRAPVGRLNITMDRIVIGRGLSSIRSKSGYDSFQYYQLKNHFHTEDMIGGGAIFNSVTKKELSDQQMLVPSVDILSRFEQMVSPFDKQILTLTKQINYLKEARNILLPRLMNQTIEVKNDF